MKYEFDFRRLLTTLGLISTLTLLTACGGGGGGDGGGGAQAAPAGNPPPAAVASSSVSSQAVSSASLSSSFNSIASSTASSAPAKPSSPNGLQATSISATQATLVWQSPFANATKYRLTRNGQIIDTIDGNQTRYTDSSLAPENQYTYRVQSGDAEGNWSPLSTGLSIRTAPQSDGPFSNSSQGQSSSSYSSASSSQGSTTDNMAPTAPAGLTTISIKDVSIDLSWEAASDDIGVTLYRILRNGEVVAITSGDSLHYLDLELQPATSYTYTVQAGDAAGNWSAASAPLTAKTTAAATEGVVLVWSHPTERENGEYLELDDIGGYEIRYRKNSLTPFTSILIEGSSTTTFGLNDLRSSYDYQIAVFDNQGLYSEFVAIAPR